LATSGLDGSIRILEIPSGIEKARYTGPAAYVSSVVFNGSGERLFAASYDGRLYSFGLSTGTSSFIEAHDGAVYSSLYFDESDLLVTGGADKKIRVWDAAGMLRSELVGHPGAVLVLAKRSPQLLLSGDTRGQVWQWDLGTMNGAAVGYNPGRIEALAARPGCDRVAIGGGDKVPVSLLDIGVSDQVWVGAGRGKDLRLSVSDDCRYVASGSQDGAVIVHDLAQHREERLNISVPISTLTFLPHSDVFVAGTSDGLLLAWDVSTDRQELLWPGLGGIQNIAVVDSTHVAVSTSSGAVIRAAIAFDWVIPSGRAEVGHWMNTLTNVAPASGRECTTCSN